MDRMSRRDFIAGAGAAGLALGAAGVAGKALSGSDSPTRRAIRAGAAAPTISPSSCPIKNVIVVMMENRSFDHVYGRLPGVEGLRRSMSNPDVDNERIYVHNQRDFPCTIGDLNHGRPSVLAQINNGAMNGFVKDTGTQTMGYFGPAELPWQYAIAEQYTVFDHWHCSLAGPTFPNREYLHAGTSAGRIANVLTPGQFGLTERTVFDQLNDQQIPWKQYFTDVPFGALYLGLALTHLNNFQGVSQFYSDAAAGALPPVCFVEPGLLIGTDDHPPASMQAGQRFLADVVTAAMHSPQWPETAIFVTYDEHGGLFDHVAPPNMPDDFPELGNPIGIRVPTMIVSPWAPKGKVASSIHDHTSITKFIQWRFLTGSPSLSKRNAAALNPVYAFDFSKMRTDVPALPVPAIDETLATLCFLGHTLPDGKTYSLPGGEGPESATRFAKNGGAVPTQSKAAAAASAALPATVVDGILTATGPDGKPLPPAQPELLALAKQGVIPEPLNQLPVPGKKTPNPFLDRSTLSKTPAWKTAARR